MHHKSRSGALLARFNIANPYRVVLVHPADGLLRGLVDGALPFGLLSAPKLFMAVADDLLWAMGGGIASFIPCIISVTRPAQLSGMRPGSSEQPSATRSAVFSYHSS